MAKPRKSTFDAWIDQFVDWSIEDQERGIDMIEFVHRQAKRRPRRDTEAVENRPEQPDLPEVQP